VRSIVRVVEGLVDLQGDDRAKRVVSPKPQDQVLDALVGGVLGEPPDLAEPLALVS
jgi:hypothetical protein